MVSHKTASIHMRSHALNLALGSELPKNHLWVVNQLWDVLRIRRYHEIILTVKANHVAVVEIHICVDDRLHPIRILHLQEKFL